MKKKLNQKKNPLPPHKLRLLPDLSDLFQNKNNDIYNNDKLKLKTLKFPKLTTSKLSQKTIFVLT